MSLVAIPANSTIDNKEVTSGTINEAISMLGAFLGVRGIFDRVANDLQVIKKFLH